MCFICESTPRGWKTCSARCAGCMALRKHSFFTARRQGRDLGPMRVKRPWENPGKILGKWWENVFAQRKCRKNMEKWYISKESHVLNHHMFGMFPILFRQSHTVLYIRCLYESCTHGALHPLCPRYAKLSLTTVPNLAGSRQVWTQLYEHEPDRISDDDWGSKHDILIL